MKKPQKTSQADKNFAAWKAIYTAIPEWKRFKRPSSTGKSIPKGLQPHEAPDLQDFNSHGLHYKPGAP